MLQEKLATFTNQTSKHVATLNLIRQVPGRENCGGNFIDVQTSVTTIINNIRESGINAVKTLIGSTKKNNASDDPLGAAKEKCKLISSIANGDFLDSFQSCLTSPNSLVQDLDTSAAYFTPKNIDTDKFNSPDIQVVLQEIIDSSDAIDLYCNALNTAAECLGASADAENQTFIGKIGALDALKQLEDELNQYMSNINRLLNNVESSLFACYDAAEAISPGFKEASGFATAQSYLGEVNSGTRSMADVKKSILGDAKTKLNIADRLPNLL